MSDEVFTGGGSYTPKEPDIDSPHTFIMMKPFYGKELCTMGLLAQVMDMDRSLSMGEKNRIAEWFHGKYFTGAES